MSAFFGIYTYIDVIDVNGNKYNNSYYFEDRDIKGAFYLGTYEKYNIDFDNDHSGMWAKENAKIDRSIEYVNKISSAKSIKEILDYAIDIYGREDILVENTKEEVETKNTFIPEDMVLADVKSVRISEQYCDFIEDGEILVTTTFENVDAGFKVIKPLVEVEDFERDEINENEAGEESVELVIDNELLNKCIDKYNSFDEDIRKYIYYHFKRDESLHYTPGQGPLIKEEEYKEVLNDPKTLIESIIKRYGQSDDLIESYFKDQIKEYNVISKYFDSYDYPESLKVRDKKILASSLIVDEIGKKLKSKGAKSQTAISGKTDIYISLSRYLESVSLNKTIELKKKKPEVMILDFNYVCELLKK